MSFKPLCNAAPKPEGPAPMRVFEQTHAVHADSAKGLRLGFDLVEIRQIARSLDHFGDAFERRLFTSGELDSVRRGEGVCHEGLAARFAAKEALIKALQLSEAGIDWREIEVRKLPSGACELLLHGRAAWLASRMGVRQLLVSMSHDGAYAGAVVTARIGRPARGRALEVLNHHPMKGRGYADS